MNKPIKYILSCFFAISYFVSFVSGYMTAMKYYTTEANAGYFIVIALIYCIISLLIFCLIVEDKQLKKNELEGIEHAN